MCPHAQRDAFPLKVNSYDTNHHLLLNFYDTCRVFHEVVGELRDVHQPLDMNAYIDESSEVGDVRHDAWQNHPLAEVVDVVNRLVEGESL